MNFRQREAAEGYLFLLPNIVGVVTFVAFPVAAAIYLSFTDWNLLRGGSFVGLENYQTLLFDDPESLNERLPLLRSITAEEVRAAAQTWLVPALNAQVRVHPEGPTADAALAGEIDPSAGVPS